MLIIAYLSTLRRCPESYCPYLSNFLHKIEVDPAYRYMGYGGLDMWRGVITPHY